MTTGETYMERENKGNGPAVSLSPTEQRTPYALPDLPSKKEVAPAPVAPAPTADASNYDPFGDESDDDLPF